MNHFESKPWSTWWIAIAVFTLMSMWPIWSERFPPLQDYPPHLLHAYMLSHRTDPAFDYSHNYDFHLNPAYATFFVVTMFFSKFLPIELAGKAALTLYPVLIATLVVWLSRRSKSDAPPWGFLLLFPFAFSQQYFHGNINFSYSLPLLCFALLDEEELVAHPITVRRVGRHLLWQLALFVTHPFTFVLYLALGTVLAVRVWRDRAKLIRVATALLMGALIFIAYTVMKMSSDESPFVSGHNAHVVWVRLGETLGFYCYMFTGMRWHDGIDVSVTTLWFVVAALIAVCLLAQGNRNHSPLPSLGFPMLAIITGLGAVLLPFSVNEYSFINFRLAAVSYFFIAILVGRLRFEGFWAVVLVTCLAVLVLQSVAKQNRISKEISAIVPIIEEIPPNSRILPLVFARTSPELDPVWFDPHLHEHDYYHLLIGGGVNPYLWQTPMQPVQLKQGLHLPAPDPYGPGTFRWEEHADDYQYFLVRGAPPSFVLYMSGRTEQRAQSGEWLLFRRKNVGDATIHSSGTPASPR